VYVSKSPESHISRSFAFPVTNNSVGVHVFSFCSNVLAQIVARELKMKPRNVRSAEKA